MGGQEIGTGWIRVRTIAEDLGFLRQSALVLFDGFVWNAGTGGVNREDVEWVPGTKDERTQWKTAARRCREEIAATRREFRARWGPSSGRGVRWTRRVPLAGHRRRADRRIRAAVEAYRPVQDEIRRRLTEEWRKREEIFAAEAAREVWRYAVKADSVIVYRDDVRPEVPLPKRASRSRPRPVDGWTLASTLRSLRSDEGIKRIHWDVAACAEVELACGDVSFFVWATWVDIPGRPGRRKAQAKSGRHEWSSTWTFEDASEQDPGTSGESGASGDSGGYSDGSGGWSDGSGGGPVEHSSGADSGSHHGHTPDSTYSGGHSSGGHSSGGHSGWDGGHSSGGSDSGGFSGDSSGGWG
ncbi:hypothetical protein [Microtetraspora niveoalba]|uniref:hypothetical protein n=1 Tax=Microtetraspora niveoalba TaxID=46175 RepID=UPI00082AF865|nr:hypothetical protein [Microtetraspora niveoalba]